jgi:hypothetical protein
LMMEAIHRERKGRGFAAGAFSVPQRNRTNFIVVILSAIALLLCYIPSTIWTIECVWDWFDSPNNATTRYTSYWFPFLLFFSLLPSNW